MKHVFDKKTGWVYLVLTTVISFGLSSPLICHGDEYSLTVNFRPEIINIASSHAGEIRVLTSMAYSDFRDNGDSILIYFNDSDTSIPNILSTSDSRGRLILTFTLTDLLAVSDDLIPDEENDADVILVMQNGDEHTSENNSVYIVDKLAP